MDELIICRCEEVSLQKIEETVRQFNCSARELKLRTRAGMGYCAGRMCRVAIDSILMELTGKVEENELPLKVQPPVRPISLSGLGGKINHE